jgi:iron complex transport system substrate-binding protein
MRPQIERPTIFWLVMTVVTLFLALQADAKTVVDQMGRRMTVPNDPERVVSLAPSITEIIFALGREDRLKGVTTYSNYPPAALGLPKVGTYIRLDLERIVALNPDLCIAIKDGNPKAAADRLTGLNIPVYAVNPRDIETVAQAVIEIGGLLNAERKASDLAVQMHARVQRVKNLVAKTTHRPRVFFQIGISPIVSVGSDTFINELIVLAGGENIAAGSTAYPRFNREQVLSLAPEVIIISSMTRGASFEHIKAEWQTWPKIPAVQNHRIDIVDSDLFDRPTPRLVEALELLVKLIHPEIFGNSE